MNLKIRDNLLTYGMHLLNKAGRLKVKRLPEIDAKSSAGILVVVTTALGDAIFCTPLFRALRKALPGKKIGLLVHRSFHEIFLDDDNLDVVIPYHGKFKKAYSTWKRLKAEGFDTALLANMNDPDIVPLLYWAGIRAMIRRPWKSTVYHYLISNPEMMGKGQPPDHAIPMNLKMAEAIGLDSDGERTYVKVNRAAEDRISSLLREQGIEDGDLLVGFHPGASLKSKMWPPEGYAELGKGILAGYPGAKIVLTGSKGEFPVCREVETRIHPERVLNAAGRLSIRELAALIERLTLFVSGDTGPFHIANAFGIKTVTIYGPSDEKTNGPLWDLDIHRVVKKGLNCYYDNCGRWCKSPLCIQQVPADTVFRECSLLLETCGKGRKP